MTTQTSESQAPPPDPTAHVIDDDAAARGSLAFLLDCHGIAARTYHSAECFLQGIATAAPGCIVTDIRMPGMTGLELVHELRARRCVMPVIVITGHADVPLAVQALHAGVADFIEKPFSDDAIVGAIRAAFVKQASSAQSDAERACILARLSGLSGRETDVMEGLLEGKANKIIANQLGISARTVEVYRANLMSKTGAQTLSELIRMVTIARMGGQGGLHPGG